MTRADQDAFALAFEMKAKAAIEAGRFAEQLVPIHVDAGKKPYAMTRPAIRHHDSGSDRGAVRKALERAHLRVGDISTAA